MKSARFIAAGFVVVALAAGCTSGSADKSNPSGVTSSTVASQPAMPQTTQPAPKEVAPPASDFPPSLIEKLKVGQSALVNEQTLRVEFGTLKCYLAKWSFYKKDDLYGGGWEKYDEKPKPPTYGIHVTRKADGYYINGVLPTNAQFLPQKALAAADPYSELVPVRNCNNLEQPTGKLSPTVNRLQEKYRHHAVVPDLKQEGSGWVYVDAQLGASYNVVADPQDTCWVDPTAGIAGPSYYTNSVKVTWSPSDGYRVGGFHGDVGDLGTMYEYRQPDWINAGPCPTKVLPAPPRDGAHAV